MDQIIQLLKQAEAQAVAEIAAREKLYHQAVAAPLAAGDLMKLAPGQHRLLLMDLRHAINRACDIKTQTALNAHWNKWPQT